MNDNTDIHVYKIVADNGGAPCVQKNLLSLAICKPRIRKSAHVGALLFGFGGKAYKERLIYIAHITRKLDGADYYTLPEFSGRQDQIYRESAGRAEVKKNAMYHQDGSFLENDVGKNFENANVLISDNFRYFGVNGTDEYKMHYPELKQLIERMKQGHRRNHTVKVRQELLRLRDHLWEEYRKRKLGESTDSDYSKLCVQHQSAIQE